MVLNCIVDEETGEVKQAPRKPATVHKAPIKQSKPAGQSDYAAARAVAESFGCPLVAHAGQMFAFSEKQGWIVVTDQVRQRAHAAKRKNGDKTIIPIIEAQLGVPDSRWHPESPIYWERKPRSGGDGSLWEGEWAPFHLGSRQVLFTDAVMDVVDNEYTSLAGRVIYGPRISLPYDIDHEPDRCDEFERMVERALPDAEIRRHFQEVMSLILQPHEILRGQIVFWGPAGTGKTTLATAIACAPTGATGASFIQESELVQNKWVAQGLVNKFANVSDDSPRVRGWPGFAKRYSSGTVSIEPKYSQPTAAPATAKLISTCNEMQDSADASGAMVDRLHPFLFGVRLGDLTDTRKMTPRHWSSPKRREGILAWLMEGLIRLRTRGKLLPPLTWERDKQEAVSAADPLEAWLRDNLVEAPGKEIEREVLMARLPMELTGTGRAAAALDNHLAEYLKRCFGVAIVRRRNPGGEKRRFYSGIDWL